MLSDLIFFVAPLPPPVHGFSEISKRFFDVLIGRHKVDLFNVSPMKWRYIPFGLFVIYCGKILGSRPKALYLALSGGHRQWIDLAFVLLARLRGVPLFVHHHSFSYLNERRTSSVVLFRALRGATHIVLCGGMGAQLAKQYGIDPANVRVLSNAAFLDDIEAPAHVVTQLSPLRVGFLSNITAEKGIFEFFAVLSQSAGAGLALQGVIAGPVDPSVKDSFSGNLAASSNVEHVGAVYGANKKAFFASIDVLLFPTQYANEAEPVTILEALGHGVPVVAFARGCIQGMVPAGAGAVFPFSDGYIKQTIEALRSLAENPAQLAQSRLAARAAFEAGRMTNKTVLDSLLDEMGGGDIARPVSA